MRVVVDFSKPKLIFKGDGNHGFHPVTGESYYLGNHPEYIMHGNHEDSHPEGYDRPMFSHYGDKDKGTKGQWGTGEYGEKVWRDEFGVDHMHGIDGLIRKVGFKLKQAGSKKDPREVVQEAIQRYNDEKTKRGDDNHTLPHVESHEWRKLKLMDYQSGKNKDETLGMKIRGSHGSEEAGTDRHNQFGTVFSNSKAHGILGRFGETYSIPMAHFIKDILVEDGIQLGKYEEGITHHNISVDDLAINSSNGKPVAGRKKGILGDQLGPEGQLSDKFLQRMGQEKLGQTVGDVHSWEMMRHLPDVMYSTGKSGRSAGIDKLAQTLLELDPKKIPPEVLNEPFFADAGGTFTLGQVISDATLANAAVRKLNETPAALHLLMGDPKQGIAGQVVNALRENINTPEDAMEYNDFRTHISAGKLKTRYQLDRRKKSHGVAADLYAFANLMGESEQGGGISAMRDLDFEHSQPLHPDVEGQRRMTEQVARLLSHHHGHTPDRPILSAEEMPSRAVGSRLSSGISNQEFGPHILDNYIHTTSPSVTGREIPNTNASFTPSSDNSTETRTATINPAARKNVAVQARAPTLDTSPTMADARQAFQYATPEQVQRVYAARQPPTQYMGGGQRTPDFSSPEAQERLARFQSSVSDLGQGRLPLTFKAEDSSVEDRLIKAMENLQIRDARLDDSVRKLLPQQKLSIYSEDDISYMASKTQITKTDVKAILLSKGDWNRISKTFKIDESIIKAVKVAFMGEL